MRARSPWRADAALVVVTVIWGSTFTLVKAALEDASTLAFLAVRFTLAATVLALLYRSRLTLPYSHQGWKGGMQAGLCLFAGYFLQTLGLRFTTPSKSAFLTSLCVVMVPLLVSLVYRSAPSVQEALGVTMAIAGTGLLTLSGREQAVNPGDLMTAGAALAFAVHILVLGHYSPRAGFEVLSVTQIATVALLALATFAWAEPLRLAWTGRLVAAWLVTGLLATALAFTIQAWAQQRTTPTHTALIFALEPVSAAATSYLVTGEVLSWRGTAGAMLILAGVLAVEMKPRRREPHLSG